MLVSLKERLNDENIQELLSAALFHDTELVGPVVEQYESDNKLKIMGYEQDSHMVALLGYSVDSQLTMEIKHLAVSFEERGMGFGRGIILHALDLEKPKLVVAETDEEAVDFYRNIGFTVQSLAEISPGIERFQCTFVTDYSS